MVLCIGVSAPFASAGLIVFGEEEPISLEMLEEQYDNILPVGDKIFSNFEIVAQANGGALTPLKSDILVQGFVIDELNLSLQFILNGFSAAAGQSADIFLTFMVEVSPDYPDLFIKDVGMRLNGVSATGTGLVSASEQVTDGPTVDLNSNILANLDTSRQDNLALDQLEDHYDWTVPNAENNFEPLDAVKKIWVTKDIQVNAGTDGSASLSGFVQSFSQVPEPTTMAMMGLGSLALFGCRRRAKRN
jgi:hypothetical protein